MSQGRGARSNMLRSRFALNYDRFMHRQVNCHSGSLSWFARGRKIGVAANIQDRSDLSKPRGVWEYKVFLLEKKFQQNVTTAFPEPLKTRAAASEANPPVLPDPSVVHGKTSTLFTGTQLYHGSEQKHIEWLCGYSFWSLSDKNVTWPQVIVSRRIKDVINISFDLKS
ncbi:hypothetical protein B0O99DRAFT_124536 [Bisporella sp. PMI_857]|nr:hypothetical protein B0O99DRAFT_124536 [Bisporella sp. PMI_857]